MTDDVEIEIIPTTEDGKEATLRVKYHYECPPDKSIDDLLKDVDRLCGTSIATVDDVSGVVVLKTRAVGWSDPTAHC